MNEIISVNSAVKEIYFDVEQIDFSIDAGPYPLAVFVAHRTRGIDSRRIPGPVTLSVLK